MKIVRVTPGFAVPQIMCVLSQPAFVRRPLLRNLSDTAGLRTGDGSQLAKLGTAAPDPRRLIGTGSPIAIQATHWRLTYG